MLNGLMNRFRRPSIPQNATFKLTQEGREKLSQFGGDPSSRILSALEQRGSSNINEISLTSGLSRGAIEHKIPGLVKAGYVQYINAQAIEGGM